MDLFSQFFTQPHLRNELILAEIIDITEQLVEIYKTTDNLADQQYIYSKLKEILQLSREQKLESISEIAFQALQRITDINSL